MEVDPSSTAAASGAPPAAASGVVSGVSPAATPGKAAPVKPPILSTEPVASTGSWPSLSVGAFASAFKAKMPGKVPKKRWVRAGAASSSGAPPGGASLPSTASGDAPTTTALIAVNEEIDDDEDMSGASPTGVPAVEGPDTNIQGIEDEEIRVTIRPKKPEFRFVPVHIVTPHSRGRVGSEHIHAWLDSRLCSIGPADLCINMTKSNGGTRHMGLHMNGINVWLP